MKFTFIAVLFIASLAVSPIVLAREIYDVYVDANGDRIAISCKLPLPDAQSRTANRCREILQAISSIGFTLKGDEVIDWRGVVINTRRATCAFFTRPFAEYESVSCKSGDRMRAIALENRLYPIIRR